MSASTRLPRAQALSAEEAGLLVEELAAVAPGQVPEVKPFALGAASSRPQQRLTGLERMGEKLARALRAVIEPLAQTRAQITPLPLQVRHFDDWCGKLPFFMSFSHYRLRPLQGGMLIAVQPEFVTCLIERFYGGGPAVAQSQRRQEFTAGEELLLARLLEKTVALLAEHWREVTPVESALVARETALTHIAFCRPDDSVVVQAFSIQPIDGEAHTLTVVYPLAMLRPIEERMASRIQDDSPSGAEQWRRALGEALEDVTLPVRSILARPEISLAGLMALKPGDVIPIRLSSRTPLLVASRPLAQGTIGEQDGRAALLIERVGSN